MPHKNKEQIFKVLVSNAMDQLELGLNIDADDALVWAYEYIRELEKDKKRIDFLESLPQPVDSVRNTIDNGIATAIEAERNNG